LALRKKSTMLKLDPPPISTMMNSAGSFWMWRIRRSFCWNLGLAISKTSLAALMSLSPSPLHPTLFLHMGRVVLLRHLSDLTWEVGDTRRFVTNMVVNLQRLPLEWSIGEVTWGGGPPPQVTLRDVSGTVTVKEPDKLMLTAKGRLEASGLPAFPKHGSLHLRGQVQHYYDATKFTGSLEWLPDPKDNQRRKESRLTCQLMGFLIPTLAEGALPEPSICSVYPADPEDRRFWTTLVGRPLPSRGQQSAR